MAFTTIPTRSSGSVFLLWAVSSLLSTISLVNSEPQNIEVYYPFTPPTPLPSPPHPPPPPPVLPPPPSPPPPGRTKSSSGKTIATAVAASAASAVVVSVLVFFVLRRRATSRRRKGESGPGPNEGVGVISREEFSRFDGHIKGLIVDENGLDVLYWRKLQGSKSRSPRQRRSFKGSEAVIASPGDGGERKAEEAGPGRRIQTVPLLIGKSSTSEHHSSPAQPQVSHTLPLVPPPRPPDAITLAAIPASNTAALPSAPPPHPPLIRGQSQNPRGQPQSLETPPPPPPPPPRASLKGSGDLMEALFGYVAANRKTPQGNNSSSPGNLSAAQPGQIFILDTQKSQYIATVLKSLSVSRKDILDAITEGRGLESDTLEKLHRITPTWEEELKILAFNGDPTRLADAESFLFHILKAIPSAFTRSSAMLLKLRYEYEILQVRESITTVELGCKELQAGGLFIKLLEAIMKAGNRMNAGNAGGKTQAFSISALKKLSDVKSTDGKTTLLHFIVEEVVRSEGRKRAINRAGSTSQSGITSMNAEDPSLKDDKEREHIMLGLPIVGGLSAKFTNVENAASIDYESFAGLCGVLQSRVSEIRQLVSQCEEGGGGFAREMKGFLESAEAEIASLRKDQTGAIELVKATAECYRAEASKEKGSNPIKLFIIIKDFLGMVDQVYTEIAQDVQKKQPAVASPSPPSSKKTMRFPKLPPDFFSESESDDSDSDS